ncbi:hypothetical protein HRG_010075 [Hirsutella rhossiliensis]|uniref:Uncharacterized protein n=1 Tax=Hirsutella rhossiliensis TaxID=111463 RepID=A0A9P8SF38_9HYPO|nr:uncharacterized protein HRG_10075 [Hirsutella rhossiliensis]KAH0959030.1 hypothetical protein HRG_10075 [Hirsutella rhossiliensis]
MPIQTLDDATFVPATPVDISMINLSLGSLAMDRHDLDSTVDFTASAWDYGHTYDSSPSGDDGAMNDDDAWDCAKTDVDFTLPTEDIDLFGSNFPYAPFGIYDGMGHAPNDAQNEELSYCDAEDNDGFADKFHHQAPTASLSATREIVVIDLTGDSEYSCGVEEPSEESKDGQVKGPAHQEADNTFVVIAGHMYPVHRQGDVELIDLTGGPA